MNWLLDWLVNFVQQLLGFRARITLTDEHKKALRLLQHSNKHVFITGRAGTGKTTLIDYFREHTSKKIVVLAPTGLAALNIRGQTVSSFFKFPPRIIQKHDIKQVRNRMYSTIDCIVIDEVSMLRADVLDGIDMFLRLNGRDSAVPFGGVQLVFVGDMFQLPPVVTDDEAQIYDQLYASSYFFGSRVYQQINFHTVELKTIFRQSERRFIDLLNAIRIGNISPEILQAINERVQPNQADGRYVVLCPTNKAVERINSIKLNGINKPAFAYQALTEGDFPVGERSLPAEPKLILKEGARVLFVKNDPAKQWVNGTLGTVASVSESGIMVKIDGKKSVVSVTPADWENIRYQFNDRTGNLEAVTVGKYRQYPLKLAWAITIHKSQGMSFNNVCLDLTHSPFAPGQTYVALSRCRTLDGLILTRRVYPNDIFIDERIVSFYRTLRVS